MAELKMDFTKMAKSFEEMAKEKGLFVGWWIPIRERLPEVGIDVLICDMEGTIYLSDRSSSDHYFDEWGNKIKDVRAWMPLPKPCGACVHDRYAKRLYRKRGD